MCALSMLSSVKFCAVKEYIHTYIHTWRERQAWKETGSQKTDRGRSKAADGGCNMAGVPSLYAET